MIDIELLWENYVELGERVTEGELSREDFGKTGLCIFYLFKRDE